MSASNVSFRTNLLKCVPCWVILAASWQFFSRLPTHNHQLQNKTYGGEAVWTTHCCMQTAYFLLGLLLMTYSIVWAFYLLLTLGFVEASTTAATFTKGLYVAVVNFISSVVVFYGLLPFVPTCQDVGVKFAILFVTSIKTYVIPTYKQMEASLSIHITNASEQFLVRLQKMPQSTTLIQTFCSTYTKLYSLWFKVHSIFIGSDVAISVSRRASVCIIALRRTMKNLVADHQIKIILSGLLAAFTVYCTFLLIRAVLRKLVSFSTTSHTHNNAVSIDSCTTQQLSSNNEQKVVGPGVGSDFILKIVSPMRTWCAARCSMDDVLLGAVSSAVAWYICCSVGWLSQLKTISSTTVDDDIAFYINGTMQTVDNAAGETEGFLLFGSAFSLGLLTMQLITWNTVVPAVGTESSYDTDSIHASHLNYSGSYTTVLQKVLSTIDEEVHREEAAKGLYNTEVPSGDACSAADGSPRKMVCATAVVNQTTGAVIELHQQQQMYNDLVATADRSNSTSTEPDGSYSHLLSDTENSKIFNCAIAGNNNLEMATAYAVVGKGLQENADDLKRPPHVAMLSPQNLQRSHGVDSESGTCTTGIQCSTGIQCTTGKEAASKPCGIVTLDTNKEDGDAMRVVDESELHDRAAVAANGSEVPQSTLLFNREGDVCNAVCADIHISSEPQGIRIDKENGVDTCTTTTTTTTATAMDHEGFDGPSRLTSDNTIPVQVLEATGTTTAPISLLDDDNTMVVSTPPPVLPNAPVPQPSPPPPSPLQLPSTEPNCNPTCSTAENNTANNTTGQTATADVGANNTSTAIESGNTTSRDVQLRHKEKRKLLEAARMILNCNNTAAGTSEPSAGSLEHRPVTWGVDVTPFVDHCSSGASTAKITLQQRVQLATTTHIQPRHRPQSPNVWTPPEPTATPAAEQQETWSELLTQPTPAPRMPKFLGVMDYTTAAPNSYTAATSTNYPHSTNHVQRGRNYDGIATTAARRDIATNRYNSSTVREHQHSTDAVGRWDFRKIPQEIPKLRDANTTAATDVYKRNGMLLITGDKRMNMSPSSMIPGAGKRARGDLVAQNTPQVHNAVKTVLHSQQQPTAPSSGTITTASLHDHQHPRMDRPRGAAGGVSITAANRTKGNSSSEDAVMHQHETDNFGTAAAAARITGALKPATMRSGSVSKLNPQPIAAMNSSDYQHHTAADLPLTINGGVHSSSSITGGSSRIRRASEDRSYAAQYLAGRAVQPQQALGSSAGGSDGGSSTWSARISEKRAGSVKRQLVRVGLNKQPSSTIGEQQQHTTIATAAAATKGTVGYAQRYQQRTASPSHSALLKKTPSERVLARRATAKELQSPPSAGVLQTPRPVCRVPYTGAVVDSVTGRTEKHAVLQHPTVADRSAVRTPDGVLDRVEVATAGSGRKPVGIVRTAAASSSGAVSEDSPLL